MKKKDYENGVWRTIGGRRVFIKTGQSLSDAMKESGKFKKKDEEKRNIKTITQEEYDKLPKDYKGTLKELVDTAEFRGENKEELRKFYEKQGFNIEEDKTILENENGGTILRPVKVSKSEDKFYTRKDGTKEYDPYKGTRFEKKYDSVEEAIKDPNSALNKYISEKKAKDELKVKRYPDEPNNHEYISVKRNLDEKLNWREQIKRNNELMEKELEDYKKNHDISRESDGYYEIFRNNERRNAKIKQEVPTEPYEYVEAYAGYHDKSYKLAGTKMSGKDVVEYGTKSWTGKEYTNDEFMEHLTDSNWHQERKMLEEAKLTNEELSYIKDHTTLSQWSVGEELTGSKNTQKMIDEAKDYSKYAKKIREKQNTPYYKQQMDKAVSDLQSSTLENKYKGTVDYLKQTTNMSGAEILELLKKIDEDKK